MGVSNKKAAIVAHYYLKCVVQLRGRSINSSNCKELLKSSVSTIKGAPRLLRCDLGTENANLAFLQPFLRRHGTDCFAEFLTAFDMANPFQIRCVHL